ncbi:amidohydrolase family protein [Streptomyces canus]|uniref:amidohydrolase family protein n=1 Tax=Streptomyces canus TaxID=58343 RepID=UPI003403622C
MGARHGGWRPSQDPPCDGYTNWAEATLGIGHQHQFRSGQRGAADASTEAGGPQKLHRPQPTLGAAEYTAELTRDHPGRFGNFVSLPLPDVDASLEEIAFAYDELEADGVALLTHTHGVYLGDQRLEPVFAELDRRRAVVFLHPTSPVGWEQSALGRPRPMVEYIFDTARTVTDLVMAGIVTRYPRIQVIVPHCGGAVPVLADRINEFMRLFLPSENTPAKDAVQQLRGLYYDMAGTGFPRQVPALLKLVDPDRVLFGSDYCWTPPPLADAHIAAIDAAESPVEKTTWRSLTTANAQRLFPGTAR